MLGLNICMVGGATKFWARTFTHSCALCFPRHARKLKRALRDRRVWHGNLLQKKKDGSDVIVACRKIMNHEGDAVLEVNRDITAQLTGRRSAARNGEAGGDGSRRRHHRTRNQ